jgi:hypothetical protein
MLGYTFFHSVSVVFPRFVPLRVSYVCVSCFVLPCATTLRVRCVLLIRTRRARTVFIFVLFVYALVCAGERVTTLAHVCQLVERSVSTTLRTILDLGGTRERSFSGDSIVDRFCLAHETCSTFSTQFLSRMYVAIVPMFMCSLFQAITTVRACSSTRSFYCN